MSFIKVKFFGSLKQLSFSFFAICIPLCLVVLMGTGCNSSNSQEPVVQNLCSPENPFSNPAVLGATCASSFTDSVSRRPVRASAK